LKKTGQERSLEYNRLKYNFDVTCVAACRLEIKKLTGIITAVLDAFT